jgi:coiled-coil domain-containing protein 12
MASTRATLDAASVDRKARLAKLASLKRKQAEPETQPDPSEGEGGADATIQAQNKTDVYLSGRNFDVQTRGPKLGFENVPSAGQITLEERAASIASKTAEQARKDEEAAEKGIDLFKLQPKKPNWDLKRDLDEKMEVLNVRTQNAIARLVRERIQKAKEEAQLKSRSVAAEQDKEGEEVGIEGNTLVEGVHLREREEQEDERREREMDEEDGVA